MRVAVRQADRVPVYVSVWNMLASSVFSPDFDEWFENRIWLPEIVVNNVHKERSIKERLHKLKCGRTRFVEVRPLLAKFVCLVLPCHEADCFNDRRLHNFLAREHPPCHGIRTLGVSIRTEVAGLVDNIISDVDVPFDVRKEDS